ncbi:hypothetical protein [Streptomyces sp. NPDC059009]|uniref:hypothetical protein n=1 Tax=Streptomyces sp. NPDC059009 TaxID=3346694 RepID=UPI0036799197
MIRFFFDVDPSELEPPSPGFALGDMEVVGSAGRVTSKGHTPDQSMMIFVALSELLDGLRALVEHRRASFRFVGSDSSFRLDFALDGKDGRITTRGGDGIVDESPAAEVLGAAHRAAHAFLDSHRAQLPTQDPARRDLEMSLEEFGDFIGPAGGTAP